MHTATKSDAAASADFDEDGSTSARVTMPISGFAQQAEISTTPHITPAHNVDAALKLATHPAPHWIVEQAARGLQQVSRSPVAPSQVAPIHSKAAAELSATWVLDGHAKVEQAARATQLGCPVVA